MTTRKAILERGYFPRELPPCFTTSPFATFVNQNQQVVQALVPPTKSARLGTYNLARSGSLRRLLSIPNPFFYLPLCTEVETHWAAIDAACQVSSLSLTRPTPTVNKRALEPACRLASRPRKRVAGRAGRRYILRTDITQFYASIYTHSIPWAIHTKAVAKANHSHNLYGNALDTQMRNLQHAQTGGVPIGPDASLAVAELILAPVDRELLLKLPHTIGFRYIDDYELCFRTRSQAEEALLTLQELLAEFELHLNPRKTSITELPEEIEDRVLHIIRDFEVNVPTPGHQERRLIQLFDEAFEGAERNPGVNTVGFTLGRLRRTPIHPQNVNLLQELLMSAAVAEAGALPHALALLQDLKLAGYQILLDLLTHTLNSVIEHHARLGHHSEVVWALWGCMMFNVGLDSDAQSFVERSDNDFVALLALQAQAQGLVQAPLNTGLWQSFQSADDLYGKHWLLAYESIVGGFLPVPGNADYVALDPCFRQLQANQVRFLTAIDPNAKLELAPAGVGLALGSAA